MDLSTLEVKDDGGIDMPLLHPATGEKLIDEETKEPLTIRLVSADSKEYLGALHKLQNSTLKKIIPGKRLQQTAEDLETQALALLASVTKGWKGIKVEGKEIPFSSEAAKELYTRFKWMREQVEAFISERSNFLGN